MALEVGDPIKGTGLSGAIAAVRKKAFPKTYNPARDPLIKPEAAAIINYLIENMEVNIPSLIASGTVTNGSVTVDPDTGIGALDDDDITVTIEERTGTIS
jgi:hypothetical protein